MSDRKFQDLDMNQNIVFLDAIHSNLMQEMFNRASMTPDYQIQSILGAIDIGSEIDLDTVRGAFGNDTDSMPAHIVTFRMTSLGVTVIVYRGGKVAFSGAKDFDTIDKARRLLTRNFKEAGMNIRLRGNLIIWNIVATLDLGGRQDIELIHDCYPEKTEYFPETFPGLVYRVPSSSLTVLAFSSGKLVLVGAKKLDEISLLISLFLSDLEKIGIISSETLLRSYIWDRDAGTQ